MKQHEVNLRRIKQLNIEVSNRREQVLRTDAMLCQSRQEQVSYVCPSYLGLDFDEEKKDVTRPSSREEKMFSSGPEHKVTSNNKEASSSLHKDNDSDNMTELSEQTPPQ